ncbi:mechanosensitive ion channel family protein [Alterinioella nitratireducens]|uniref:mechanosensitive ion channel family protein n=1 Tax=Alterinioella nitratireducens TaxID=2735915 RepID=UPI001551D5C1|nr:mechanosensitive ion channel family protein [Alterinioella nitratireducens]NPD18439.1 mechanosensitive ion channel [Alterinioella nitratireducens]
MRLILLLALLALPLPALAQDAAQPEGTISVENSLEEDAAIAVRIREIIRQLDGYDDVTVYVANGIVTLRGTTLDAATASALNGLVSRVEGVVAIENEVEETTDVVERLTPAVERLRARTMQFISFLPLMLIAVVAGLLVMWFGFFIARRKNPWDRMAPNAFIADIYRQITRLFFVVMGVVMALDLLNLTALLSTILGAAGIVGLAIGFAVRDTVENFIASIMLSMRQPFRPKDLVEIEGDTGHVIRLTSRATILLSPDGNHIRIPNATVFKARIVNFTRNDERRFTFTLGIDANADPAEAQNIILAALAELPFLLTTPGPSTWVEEVGDSNITITAAAWVKQHETGLFMARGEAIRMAKARLEEAGITLPEPTYRLITQPAETAKPAPAPEAAPAVALPVRDEETQELERIVDAERADTQHKDLLAHEAPQE